MNLGMFYFTLGNVRPQNRSKLSAINLVAIAKYKHVSQYGMDAILKPFVKDLKKLVSSTVHAYMYAFCLGSVSCYLFRKMGVHLS